VAERVSNVIISNNPYAAFNESFPPQEKLFRRDLHIDRIAQHEILSGNKRRFRKRRRLAVWTNVWPIPEPMEIGRPTPCSGCQHTGTGEAEKATSRQHVENFFIGILQRPEKTER
ncbi:MAG: hypothetical protein MUF20_04025, partial [Methylotetracoccus sp.]|nr:hypothetical protein [Methylotetracoccus sp.]